MHKHHSVKFNHPRNTSPAPQNDTELFEKLEEKASHESMRKHGKRSGR